jgi:hypothetical protein
MNSEPQVNGALNSGASAQLPLLAIDREPARYMALLEAEVNAYEKSISGEMTALGFFTASAGAGLGWLCSFLLAETPEEVWRQTTFYAIGLALVPTTALFYAQWRNEVKNRPRLTFINKT